MDRLSWLMKARDAGMVQRAHTVRTVEPNYRVADHSFNMMLIAECLLDECGVDAYGRSFVYERIMLHDLPEIYTGDIPAPRKEELKEVMDKLEKKWEEENVPGRLRYTLSRKLELIITLADKLELVMFCTDEAISGNRQPTLLHMFHKALTNAERAADTLTECCGELYPRYSGATARQILSLGKATLGRTS